MHLFNPALKTLHFFLHAGVIVKKKVAEQLETECDVAEVASQENYCKINFNANKLEIN